MKTTRYFEEQTLRKRRTSNANGVNKLCATPSTVKCSPMVASATGFLFLNLDGTCAW